eukprot:XP_001699154.1 predicted protein [Chlamydomonas reinhardtii]
MAPWIGVLMGVLFGTLALQLAQCQPTVSSAQDPERRRQAVEVELPAGLQPDAALFDAAALGSVIDFSGGVQLWQDADVRRSFNLLVFNGSARLDQQPAGSSTSGPAIYFNGRTFAGLVSELPWSAWSSDPAAPFTAVWIGRLADGVDSSAEQWLLGVGLGLGLGGSGDSGPPDGYSDGSDGGGMAMSTSRLVTRTAADGYGIRESSVDSALRPPMGQWSMEVLVRNAGAASASYLRCSQTSCLATAGAVAGAGTRQLASSPRRVGPEAFSVGGDFFYAAGTSPKYLTGHVAVVALYSRALSQVEVAQLAAVGLAITSVSCVVHNIAPAAVTDSTHTNASHDTCGLAAPSPAAAVHTAAPPASPLPPSPLHPAPSPEANAAMSPSPSPTASGSAQEAPNQQLPAPAPPITQPAVAPSPGPAVGQSPSPSFKTTSYSLAASGLTGRSSLLAEQFPGATGVRVRSVVLLVPALRLPASLACSTQLGFGLRSTLLAAVQQATGLAAGGSEGGAQGGVDVSVSCSSTAASAKLASASTATGLHHRRLLRLLAQAGTSGTSASTGCEAAAGGNTALAVTLRLLSGAAGSSSDLGGGGSVTGSDLSQLVHSTLLTWRDGGGSSTDGSSTPSALQQLCIPSPSIDSVRAEVRVTYAAYLSAQGRAVYSSACAGAASTTTSTSSLLPERAAALGLSGATSCAVLDTDGNLVAGSAASGAPGQQVLGTIDSGAAAGSAAASQPVGGAASAQAGQGMTGGSSSQGSSGGSSNAGAIAGGVIGALLGLTVVVVVAVLVVLRKRKASEAAVTDLMMSHNPLAMFVAAPAKDPVESPGVELPQTAHQYQHQMQAQEHQDQGQDPVDPPLKTMASAPTPSGASPPLSPSASIAAQVRKLLTVLHRSGMGEDLMPPPPLAPYTSGEVGAASRRRPSRVCEEGDEGEQHEEQQQQQEGELPQEEEMPHAGVRSVRVTAEEVARLDGLRAAAAGVWKGAAHDALLSPGLPNAGGPSDGGSTKSGADAAASALPLEANAGGLAGCGVARTARRTDSINLMAMPPGRGFGGDGMLQRQQMDDIVES